MEFPDSLVVQLESDDPRLSDLSDILLTLDTYHDNRCYFGALMGLTNDEGCLEYRRRTLEEAFLDDQRTFMMDYKVPLSDCDPKIIVRIQGGRDFRVHQALIRDEAMVLPWAKAIWAKGRNGALVPTSAELDMSSRAEVRAVTVKVRLSGSEKAGA